MTIKIAQHVRKGNEYSHYPGQVLIDHPDEKELIAAGKAVPVIERQMENAVLAKAETRKAKR